MKNLVRQIVIWAFREELDGYFAKMEIINVKLDRLNSKIDTVQDSCEHFDEEINEIKEGIQEFKDDFETRIDDVEREVACASDLEDGIEGATHSISEVETNLEDLTARLELIEEIPLIRNLRKEKEDENETYSHQI